jgi:hypothetical protein
MGPKVSRLHFLGGVDFEIPASAVASQGSQSILQVFRADPLALAVAEPIVQSLRSLHYTVTAPKREGKGSVWFRCEMEHHDAGIAVFIKERRPSSLIVSTFACQMKKAGQKEIDPSIDPSWPAVSHVIKAAIEGRYGQQPGFAWHDEERYHSSNAEL